MSLVADSCSPLPDPRKLLVIDTSYGYDAIVSRKLEASVTCRDLDGFFQHVWTVHPVDALVAERSQAKCGEPEVHSLAAAHTFIAGKIGRFSKLERLPIVNFALAQADLLRSLERLIRRENISAIRAGDPVYAGLLGLLLARRCRIPLLVRVGSNLDAQYAATGQPHMPRLFRSYRVEKHVIRFVLSRADVVAGANQDNLDFALANGARPHVSTLFRYGNLLDRRHLAPPESRDTNRSMLKEFWSEPSSFLLYIGRLEPVKRPEDVIRVLAEVRRRGHDVKAILVGDGRMRAALGELAKELGTAEHVVFTGNRDQEWLSRIIPLASAVVSPHTGRALSEAAFGAAPIVAYDLDWQRELIVAGETGELVPAGSWMTMADAVERFVLDPAYARRMGDAVRRRALELLDPAVLNQHERDTYTALFQRFGGRAMRVP